MGVSFEGELCVKVGFVCLCFGLECVMCVLVELCMRCVCGCCLERARRTYLRIGIECEFGECWFCV